MVPDIFNFQDDMKQVIVTGATGFIGQHIIPLLLEKNIEVIAIARDENKARFFDWYSSVSFVSLDIHNDKIDFKLNKGVALIHLAWQGLPNYKSLFHFEENLPKNYEFIKSLIYKGVNNILVTGTCFEYGFQYGPIPANTITQPANPYAFSKDILRQYLTYLKVEIPFNLKWARLFYMYGRGQNSLSIIASLDRAIDRGDPIFDMSGGEQLRDYLPVETVAEKLVEIFESKKEGNFNVCSGSPISVRRLVEQRIKERKSNIKINLV